MAAIALPRGLLVAAVLLLAVGGEVRAADAGETLTAIKSRGTVRCGVDDGVVGFAATDWMRYGLPITLCQLAVSTLYVLALFRLVR